MSNALVESIRVGFVIDCDEADLAFEEGVELARRLADELIEAAMSRTYARAASE